jgi:uncharacterized membrane protein
MRVDQIMAGVAEHLVGRLLRRALIAAVMAACAVVALYHFTIAGTIALQGPYGDLYARLIVGGIYALLSIIALSILWAMRSKPAAFTGASALSNPREIQLVMLVEAVMLGYTLARKRERAS